MNRDEYLAMLATEPATPAQVGAIQGEFGRLGVADRGERLAVSAALLGLDSLGSTTDLVMGQAGKLVGILRRVRDRAELPEIPPAADSAAVSVDDDEPAAEHQDQAGEHRPYAPATWPEAVAFAIALVCIAVRKQQRGELGNVASSRQFNSARDGRLPAHSRSA